MMIWIQGEEAPGQIKQQTKLQNENIECINNSDPFLFIQCIAVKIFFDDEISRCLEVNSPLQTVLLSLFWSKLSSEYKRIFVGPFLQCEITLL